MTQGLGALHHVGVVVADIEASIGWYAEHLGFEQLFDFAFPGARVAFVRRGSIRIEFFQVEGASPIAAERQAMDSHLKVGGLNHFALAVDDLDRVVATLEANGVRIASPPRDVPGDRGERFAFIQDNEGMLVELYQPEP